MSNLQRVPQFLREHPEWSEGSMRWLIFNAESNGLNAAGAIVRVGRRVFIDTDRFDGWIESQARQRGTASA